MATPTTVLEDILELARLARPAWDDISAGIPAWHPRNEGDDETPDEEADTEEKPEEGDENKEPDWKALARKHEANAKDMAERLKKNHKERDELAAKLKERETADLSEQEQAIAKARDEATASVKAEAAKAQRSDRLDSAVTRLATKGIKLDDETVKFADPDDVLTHIERQIEKGKLDADTIFDSENVVQTDSLTEALAQLAADKPHWLARDNGPGENDAGKGTGGRKSREDMTVEEHLKDVKKQRSAP